MIGSGGQVLVGRSGDRAGVAVRHHSVDQPVRAAVGDVLGTEAALQEVLGVVAQPEIQLRVGTRPGSPGLGIGREREGELRGREARSRGEPGRCACDRLRRSRCARPTSARRSGRASSDPARRDSADRAEREWRRCRARRETRASPEAVSRTGSSPRDVRFRSRAAPGRGTAPRARRTRRRRAPACSARR